MTVRTDQAVTEATAQSKSTQVSYFTLSQKASRIDDVLARLLLGFETRHHGPRERTVVAGKIDLGLLSGGQS